MTSSNPITSTDTRWIVTSALLAAADKGVVIHCGAYTLGLHPDAARRENGELALLDWSRPGGELVETEDPGGELADRMGQIRAMGALARALCSARGLDGWIGDVQAWARESEPLTHLPGGPVDRDLRAGLALRAVALQAMGRRGGLSPRFVPRPGDVGTLDPVLFQDASHLAHVRMTEADQALLAPATAA